MNPTSTGTSTSASTAASTGASTGASTSVTPSPANAFATPVDGQTMTVPLVEESVHVEKAEVDRGGYRVTKRVDQHDALVDALLRHRNVDIERRPINEVVQEMPLTRYEGDTLVVPVVKEVLVTEKRLMLVEEVRIRQIEGSSAVSETVSLRTEAIAIERLQPEQAAGTQRP